MEWRGREQQMTAGLRYQMEGSGGISPGKNCAWLGWSRAGADVLWAAIKGGTPPTT